MQSIDGKVLTMLITYAPQPLIYNTSILCYYESSAKLYLKGYNVNTCFYEITVMAIYEFIAEYQHV